jgi:hypothetical protein
MELGIRFGALLPFVLLTPLLGGEPIKRTIDEADDVLAMYRENGKDYTKPFLILTIWGDGNLVWSEHRLTGGAPYHSTRIDPKRAESLLSGFEADGLFETYRDSVSYVPPDAPCTEILIKHKKRKTRLRSTHETEESRGGIVAGARWARPLGSQKLFEALRSEPTEYLFFRMVWNEIRVRSASLIPSTEREAAGELRIKDGVMSWTERE